MNIELEFAQGMAGIERAEWDSLASRYDCPLLSWGFLALLEESGSITAGTGWGPHHLLARRDGRLVAAAPFYVRSHSMGDFVFDFAFAEAAGKMGAPYYPKLVGAVPATPSPVWRVLVAEGEDEEVLGAIVIGAAAEAAREAGLGGLHLLWVDPAAALPIRKTALPLTEWKHQSFLWSDAGFGDFQGYLDAFTKNMRRNVLRERASVRRAGIESRIIEAEEAAVRPDLLERMADFYEDTNAKFGPWGAKFLTREFFTRLPEYMATGWVLSAAFGAGEGEGDPVGLAFLFRGKERLWGRWWGSSRFVDSLHFELCYYRPIEYALSRGIGSFDPGMGSEHKARRGFASLLAPSFHLAFDGRMRRLFEYNLPLFNAEEAEGARILDADLPWKRNQSGTSTL
ncbi:MAG: hypothetical protein A2Z99_01820 [Treponema sp. GWB1_62_6]|nr:MAG: hypothetical protein A2001_11315 [Treponema sp. GWC1_61_84]OHE70904.1 MAG: hypothetical protein A2Z99_01820 [Treponema sp. GWB1_62_6]HCM26320.1 GNAT family N-acetyltransferase [Treponema sp.]